MAKSVRYIALTNQGPLGLSDSGDPVVLDPETDVVPTFTEKQATDLAQSFSHTGRKGRPRRVDILSVK